MKYIILLTLFILSLSVRAQYTSFQPDAVTSATTQQQPPKEESKIEVKYAVGACPEVGGKVEWRDTINCVPLTAQQIYDKAIQFLMDYCKEEDKDPNSRIAIVNQEKHEIGARILEYVTFVDKALIRDRALLTYTLRLNCYDGRCEVIMQNMSYKYEGGNFPAEDMLLDSNALNKTQTDFKKGGYRKFRTKTIDAKDALFDRLALALIP